jgi:hypothetical protein
MKIKSIKIILIIFALMTVGSCSKVIDNITVIKGSFGFNATDERDIEEPEKSRISETEFRLVSGPLHFYSYETIWWMYRIESGYYKDEDLLMVLYTNNSTPTPVESELRRVKTQKTGSAYPVIRDYFRDLEPGKYILAIAQNSKVVDKVEFKVHPTPDITGGTYDPEWDKEQDTESENPD